MAQNKKTSKPKPKSTTKTKKRLPPRVKESLTRVVVLQTATQGHQLVIRSNPTTEQVESFVADQHRRHAAGVDSGTDERDRPVPSFAILRAVEYATEKDRNDPTIKGRPIRIKGTLPKSQWPSWADKD